jgi:putative transposase
MLETNHPLSIRKQCELLKINRTAQYYHPRANNNHEAIIANRIHEIWNELPFYGYRRITAQLQREGYDINHKRVSRLMHVMNLQALYPKTKCSRKDDVQPHPYLLKNLSINKANQVWATDLTYIKLPSGFVYLVALIDIYSRKIMGWKLSITMEVIFCLEMLMEAVGEYGIPIIINTDQGSQYTSTSWVEALQAMAIRISMDGKGRWADNVYVERLWRTIKQENIYLYGCDTIKSLRVSITEFVDFYNTRRLHQSLGYHTPDEVYQGLCAARELVHYSKREAAN